MKEFIEKLIERLEEYEQSHLIEHDSELCKHCQGMDCLETSADCTICVMNKAIEIVQELEKEYKGGWIPCSERLPEKQGSYLIQDNHNNIKVAHYDYNTQHTYRAWWIDYTKVNVLAWCELPAPYKEGE